MTVTVYTSPTCSYCRMLKEFLARRGIVFEEHDVSRDASAGQEAVRISGQNGAPASNCSRRGWSKPTTVCPSITVTGTPF